MNRFRSWPLVLVYLLVLATNLPHLYFVYADYERGSGWWAAGMALAFDLSLGLFTYRRITIGRARWRDRGIGFFVFSSALANLTYYYGGPLNWATPFFLALAIPLSLVLFAEEFGADVRRESRFARKEELIPEEPERGPAPSTKTARAMALIREQPNLTNQEVAEMAGCDLSTVSRAKKALRDGRAWT